MHIILEGTKRGVRDAHVAAYLNSKEPQAKRQILDQITISISF